MTQKILEPDDFPAWLDRKKTPEQRRDAWAEFVRGLEKRSKAPRSNLNEHYCRKSQGK